MSSYWIESTKNIEKKYPKLEENIETDVCIIGGGLSGISSAYELAKCGVKVVVLEKEHIGKKTTGNTTGKITSQHGLFYDYLIQSEGGKFAKKYLDANEQAIKNIKNIIDAEKIECDFEYQDAYVYTQKQEEIKKIEKEVQVLKQLNFDCEFVNKTDLPFDILGAIKFKNQAQFNVRKYLFGLANCIENNGGKIFENSKVYDLKKDSDKYLTYCDNICVRSKYVVIASHYPIINFPGFYFLKMYQSMSYAIAIETNQEIFNGMYINSESPTKSIRNIKDGNKRLLLIAGSDHKTGAKINLLNAYKDLEKIAKGIYPDCRVKYKWHTEDCITLDKIPYIGEFSKFMPNVYVATGYKKWGITTSNIASNIIKDKILNKSNKYEEIFKAIRMEPIKNIKEVENMLKETTNSLVINKMKIPKDKISNINKEDARIIEIDGKKVGVYKDKQGELYAVKPVCSHLGCELSFNNLAKTWDCPCHGSRFDYKGNSIYSPSIKNLESWKIEDE